MKKKLKLTKINEATAALVELIVSCVLFGFDALLCACDEVSDLRGKRPLAGEPRLFIFFLCWQRFYRGK